MLVRPEVTSAANTGLDLINHHVDAELGSESADTLSELRREVVVATLRLNGLDNHSTYFAAFLNTPLFDFGAHILKCKSILFSVVLNIVGERVLVAGVHGCRPVQSGHINLVHSLGS